VLRVTKPASPLLKPASSWADRQKVPPYNLFYADIEADAKARVAAALGRADLPASAASIESRVVVGDAPVHGVE